MLSGLARTIHVALMVLLLAQSLPSAQAQPAPAHTTLLVRPNGMERLAPDPWLGGVWIATNVGVFHKDLTTGEIEHYLSRSGLASQHVYDIVPTPEAVWLATEFGVSVLDRSTGKARYLSNADGTLFLHGSGVLLAEGDNVWVGTGKAGLFRADTSTLVATPVPNPVNGSDFEHPIYGLDADGPELFISASKYGLVRWNRETGETTRSEFSTLVEDPQYQRIVATPDDVWISTLSEGVIAWNRETGNNRQWAGPGTTLAPNISGLLQVGDEMWFANRGGVARYTMSTDSWQNWRLGDTGLGADDVAFVDGVLYAQNAQEVYRFDRAASSWSLADWWSDSMIVRHNVIQSCVDEGDRFAFGTGGGGANFLDLSSGRWVRAGPEDGDKSFPNDINVIDIASDGTRRWLTTHNGVSELDIASGVYTNFYTDGRAPGTRGLNLVKDVALDGDEVWFGTSSKLQTKQRPGDPDYWNRGNVARMEKGERSMQIYRMTSGLSSDNVTSVEPDVGRVWVGSLNGGVDSIDRATDQVTHVYPAGGTANVLKMLLRPEGLWLATTEGLILLNRTTLEPREVSGLDGIVPTAMAWADGVLWIGAAARGLRTVNIASMSAMDSYTSGHLLDITATCMLPRGDILYVGTTWGVQRFDMATRQFLPQILRWDPDAVGRSPGLLFGNGQLGISSPDVGQRLDPADPLNVTGSATGPAGSRVLVHADDGPWMAADGVSSWSVTLPEDPSRSGKVTLAARLESNGHVLAFATRVVVVGDGDLETVAEARLRHTPLLEATTGESLRFTVAGNRSLQDLGGLLYLRRPGAARFEAIPMERDLSNTLSASVEPFNVAGIGEYRILVDWEGGSGRLPAPLTGFGPSYTVVVKSPTGLAAARLLMEPAEDLRTGSDGSLKFTVQNLGSRDAAMELAFSGPVAAWLVDPPASADVPAGESRAYTLKLQVPAGANPGQYALDLFATPDPKDGSPAQERFTVTVADGTDSTPPENRGSPFPSWLALAALAVAALASRRR
ncbi:MAG TPA: NEW3 domain-containing protein [Candidatus Thermoplasmatota archaeon]|nr:NEW3 domain-containing protein [Candidatus Thermoplasmatota archaeon]